MCCFIRFPNGPGSYPSKLTKLNKVPITTLHLENIPLSGYIDDFFLKNVKRYVCMNGYIDDFPKEDKTMCFYDKLGFVVNFKKSEIVPTQRIIILDFVIDSVKNRLLHLSLSKKKRKK